MFKIIKTTSTSRARLGVIETAHGELQTPAYAIVATHGEVKTINSKELNSSSAELLIANTFHIWQNLGEEGIESCKGVHKQLGWAGPVITDSGGFQVFSYGAARVHGTGKVGGAKARPGAGISQITIDEDGVSFLVGDEPQRLDSEKSIALQQKIGADIIVAFDEPTSPHHDREYTLRSLDRTHRWAERSLQAKTSNQLIYGVTQGGSFEDLRPLSAKYIGSLGFDGFAIGGCFSDSFGSNALATKKELEYTIPHLPLEKPRHLLGIGRVADVINAVEAGIDTMDCVIPTREARHGGIWTVSGRVDVKKSDSKEDERPLDDNCGCDPCSKENITRKELRELFKARDLRAGRLATLHNIYFFNQLMRDIRQNIADDSWSQIREKYKVFL